MQKKSKYKIAVFLIVFFTVLISAPTIILSFDDSVDVSNFNNINEEEENENLKVVFKDVLKDSEDSFFKLKNASITRFTLKTYPKPNLNLILPPPEFI